VRLLVRGEAAAEAACELLGEGSGIEIVRAQFGDIWLRDTGPIFVKNGEETVAAAFRFNGWGGKYVLDDDDLVPEQIAAAAGSPRLEHDFVLEGGAVESDGLGAVLTTRQCLLNPNRNRGWTQSTAEAELREALGAKKVVWLGQGLANDHTDGHVDNLARFVAPGVVACPVGIGRDDPNTDVYGEAARLLASSTDARGQPIQVMRLPSPGRILDDDGDVVPASHMNFVIANEAVVMPVYEEQSSPLALEALGAMFPEREVIGLSSRAILTGGGSFHCITQPEPA
jgi:agmatine deiminase